MHLTRQAESAPGTRTTGRPSPRPPTPASGAPQSRMESTNRKHARPDARPSRRRALQGPLLYYLLATFDVLTVSASLYLNHRIMQIYVGSVSDNHVWAQRMADYSALGQFAADVNAPGNDVFDSRDIPRESARMELAFRAFQERLEALRNELRTSALAEESTLLLERMEGIDDAMAEMAEEARLIFSHFRGGRSSEAGERMATMDRRYARVLTELRGLGDAVASIQLEHLDRQTAAAAALQRFEYVIAGLILVMVGAATIYGRRIYREAARDAEERASHLAELEVASESLRRAHADLEERVEARTHALRESEAARGRAARDWQRTFEAIDSPVMILDHHGRARRLNRAACEQAGRPAEELVGQPLETLGAGEPWRTAARLVRQVYEGKEPATFQARDDRNDRTWEISGNLVASHKDGEERITVVARDVTRLIDLQESVRREERMSAMGSLVAHVAHEVRNPLFGISSTLDAFEARHGEAKPLQKYLPVLRREVDRLGTLMGDLLDYGRPMTLDSHDHDFDEVLSEALALCEPSARSAGVQVEVSASRIGLVTLDRARITQVLQNVIQNAIQHSPEGDRVSLFGERLRDGAHTWASCTVRDRGPGFDKSVLAKIFEPFFTRRRGGTGLGLSIAQRIVSEHGGQLMAGNHPRGGAVVTLRLPCADGQERQDP